MKLPYDLSLERAADLVRAAKRLVVLTGAGVSKESGIPTFRDAQTGLWANFDPTRLATRNAFTADPKLVWEFYESRRARMQPARPNPSHRVLAALEGRFPGYPLITQNIDQLHEEAGSTNVIHLHGLIALDKCLYDCQGDPTMVDAATAKRDPATNVPLCPHCGNYIRPAVVWFGEILPAAAIQAASAALADADLMLVVGTSGVVMPAANMPFIAKQNGAKVIEVNPDESEITPIADVWLQAPSGEALPRLLDLLTP